MGTSNFDEIHILLQNKQYGCVEALLLNSSKDNLNAPYLRDANHAWYILGDIAYKSGNYSKAVDAFNKSCEINPHDVAALMALSNCYFELKEFYLAEKILKKALQLNLTPSLESEILYNLGNALFDQKKYSDACHYYKKIVHQKGQIAKMAKHNLNCSLKMCAKCK